MTKMRQRPFTGNLAKHLERIAGNVPDSIAILFQSDPSFKKTFSQLNTDVINCASFLKKEGIKKERGHS